MFWQLPWGRSPKGVVVRWAKVLEGNETMKLATITAVLVVFAAAACLAESAEKNQGGGEFIPAAELDYPDGNTFVSMDFDSSGGVDISDISRMLNWMFLGGSGPACQDAMDFNANGQINVMDVVSGLNFLFSNSGAVPFNGEGCQVYLSCDQTLACE